MNWFRRYAHWVDEQIDLDEPFIIEFGKILFLGVPVLFGMVAVVVFGMILSVAVLIRIFQILWDIFWI